MSRVGGSAQIKAMKKVAGTLRLDLANFREMAAFAQFGSDLDAATQRLLAKGERLVELLKQGQYSPLPVERQIVVLFAGTNEFVSEVPVAALGRYESELLAFIDAQHEDIFASIRTEKKLSDDVKEKLKTAIAGFTKTFLASLES